MKNSIPYGVKRETLEDPPVKFETSEIISLIKAEPGYKHSSVYELSNEGEHIFITRDTAVNRIKGLPYVRLSGKDLGPGLVQVVNVMPPRSNIALFTMTIT